MNAEMKNAVRNGEINQARLEGWKAGITGQGRCFNPYKAGSDFAKAWLAGYDESGN